MPEHHSMNHKKLGGRGDRSQYSEMHTSKPKYSLVWMHYGYSWLETLPSDNWVKIQLIKLNSDNQENKIIISLVVSKNALTGSSIYVAENLETFKHFRKQSNP